MLRRPHRRKLRVSDPNSHSEPLEGWAILRSGGQSSGAIEIPTKPMGVTGPMGQVRMALGKHGEARLLLPLAASEDPRMVVGAPALAIEAQMLRENGNPKRFLDVTCKVKELDSVFARIVQQILLRITDGETAVEAVRCTLEDFRNLLNTPASSDVTQPMIAGLVGELIVLKRLLDISPEAWKVWQGPAGARHDFTRSSVSLEVKVTLGKGRTKITVNGLEQLSEPCGGRLFLQHFELEPATGGMFSVSTLGHAVMATGGAPVGELLAAAGCSDVDSEAWNATAFRLEGETLYEVRPGFPRLVPLSFPGGAAPEGVSEIRYTTNLSEAAGFRVDLVAARELERLLIAQS